MTWHKALITCLLSTTALGAGDDPQKSEHEKTGIVYIVLAVDTEPLHIGGSGKRLEIDLSNFAIRPDSGEVSKVMAADWRSRFSDTFGGHPKITWFVLTSQHLCEAAGCTAVYHALLPYTEEMNRWGDEIGWHYHHSDWFECD